MKLSCHKFIATTNCPCTCFNSHGSDLGRTTQVLATRGDTRRPMQLSQICGDPCNHSVRNRRLFVLSEIALNHSHMNRIGSNNRNDSESRPCSRNVLPGGFSSLMECTRNTINTAHSWQIPSPRARCRGCFRSRSDLFECDMILQWPFMLFGRFHSLLNLQVFLSIEAQLEICAYHNSALTGRTCARRCHSLLSSNLTKGCSPHVMGSTTLLLEAPRFWKEEGPLRKGSFHWADLYKRINLSISTPCLDSPWL